MGVSAPCACRSSTMPWNCSSKCAVGTPSSSWRMWLSQGMRARPNRVCALERARLGQRALVRQERRGLHEEHRQRRHGDVGHRVSAITSAAPVRQLREARPQPLEMALEAPHGAASTAMMAGQHRQALRRRHGPVAPAPTRRLALDRLPMREVPPRARGPVHPVGLEVEPDLLGDRPRLVHHLQRHAAPAIQQLVVQRRGVPRHHRRARQPLEQLQQRHVVAVPVVVPVAARGLARALQVRRVAVHQLRTVEREPRQISVTVPVDQFHRIIALERRKRPPVQVDPDVAQRPRLALHRRPTAQVRLDVHRVRRHQRHQRLPQPRRRLRSEPPVSHDPHHRPTALWCQAPFNPTERKIQCDQ